MCIQYFLDVPTHTHSPFNGVWDLVQVGFTSYQMVDRYMLARYLRNNYLQTKKKKSFFDRAELGQRLSARLSYCSVTYKRNFRQTLGSTYVLLLPCLTIPIKRLLKMCF